MSDRRLKFGDYELDCGSGKLLRNGRPVKLQPQPLRVLALLAEHPGEIVSREQLRERIWGDATFVVFDDGLNYCIRQIRLVLGDDAVHPRYVETLPKQGYRLIAAVAAKVESPGSQESALTEEDHPSVVEPGRMIDGGAAAMPSIAVLPFANTGAEKETEYFSDGLVEEIINELAQVPGIRVAGRTSSFFFRGKNVELAEIGKRLGVTHILEGSVRKAGTRVRITAQLIKVTDGFHLWSERYEREMTDIFAVQDGITVAIARALLVKLSPETAQRPRYVPDLRAYEAFLEGREHLLVGSSSQSLERGKKLLEHAVALDSHFALPLSVLGAYYTRQAAASMIAPRQALELARAQELAALRIDPELPEAHAMMGVIAGMDYDWVSAERHWRAAMAQEPVSRDVQFWYANHYLLARGCANEAANLEVRLLETDPLNFLYRTLYATALLYAGRLSEGEAELRKVPDLEKNELTLSVLGLICAQQGRLDDALALTERAYSLKPKTDPIAGQLAAILMRRSDHERGEAILETFRSSRSPLLSVGLAVFHALCHEFDQAYEWGARAVAERCMNLVPRLGPLMRSTAQWPILAKLMNLPT